MESGIQRFSLYDDTYDSYRNKHLLCHLLWTFLVEMEASKRVTADERERAILTQQEAHLAGCKLVLKRTKKHRKKLGFWT